MISRLQMTETVLNQLIQNPTNSNESILRAQIKILNDLNIEKSSMTLESTERFLTKINEAKNIIISNSEIASNKIYLELQTKLMQLQTKLCLFQIEFAIDDYWYTYRPNAEEAEYASRNFKDILVFTCNEFIKTEFLLKDKPFAEYFAEFENYFISKGVAKPLFTDYRKRLSMSESTEILLLCYKSADGIIFKQFVDLFDMISKPGPSLDPKINLKNTASIIEQRISNNINSNVLHYFSEEKIRSLDQPTKWKLLELNDEYAEPSAKNKINLKFLLLFNEYLNKALVNIKNNCQQDIHASYIKQSQMRKPEEAHRSQLKSENLNPSPIRISRVEPDFEALVRESQNFSQPRIVKQTEMTPNHLDEDSFTHILPSSQPTQFRQRTSAHQTHSFFSQVSKWISSNIFPEYTNKPKP